jgi:hypothetical protein
MNGLYGRSTEMICLSIRSKIKVKMHDTIELIGITRCLFIEIKSAKAMNLFFQIGVGSPTQNYTELVRPK